MNKIEYTDKPIASDIDFITDKLNQETPEYGETSPFAFYIKDENLNIIAFANGYLFYGAIYTDQLWVEKGHRGKGLGEQLMEKVHMLGRSEGCKFSTLLTMSFQGSESFYEKLGYIADFRRAGYINNNSAIFMRKNLE